MHHRRCVTITAALVIMTLAAAVPLAAASKSLKAPKHAATITMNTTEAWARVKPDRTYEEHVMFMAGGTVVAVMDDTISTHAVFHLPPGVRSPVAYWAQPYNGYLLLAPTPNSLAYYECDSPFSPYGQSCKLKLYKTLPLAAVPANTAWVDVAIGVSESDGNEFGFLIAADRTIVAVKSISTPDDAKVTATLSLDTLVPSVTAKYPYVLSAVTREGSDEDEPYSVWFTLAAYDPSSSSTPPPGVVLTFDIATMTVVRTTYALATPVGVVDFTDNGVELLAITSYAPNATDLVSYRSDEPGVNVTAAWGAAGVTASASAVAIIEGRSYAIYVASVGTDVDMTTGLTLVFVDAETGRSSPLATLLSSTPSLTAKVLSQSQSQSDKYVAYVPCVAATGEAVIEVFTDHWTDALVRDPRPQRKHTRPATHARSSTVLCADNKLCTDTSMPSTCLMACDPLPAVACSPFYPGPTTVDSRPAACYLLPAHPDVCNYCPPQWASHCP